ncbi:hypothetical protein HBI93_096000, partial [Parastagonospora nodorum]
SDGPYALRDFCRYLVSPYLSVVRSPSCFALNLMHDSALGITDLLASASDHNIWRYEIWPVIHPLPAKRAERSHRRSHRHPHPHPARPIPQSQILTRLQNESAKRHIPTLA